jgi:phospholipase D1/2
LVSRIARSHREGKKFKVIVVCPLLPEFDGELGETSGTAIETVLHWNYHSMFRGEHSLMQKLAKKVPDPSNYVMFFGLRNHGELKGKPVTEIVYVHSKLMIVDDKAAIIGSANINDRSMMGRRDSEIAVLVTDVEMITSKMNGHEYPVGKFCHSLRLKIFGEHLGITSSDDAGAQQLSDPISDQFLKVGIQITHLLLLIIFLVRFYTVHFRSSCSQEHIYIRRSI